VTRRTNRRAAVVTVLAVLALGACDTGDGREMRPPTEPRPATTTTTLVPASTLGG